MKVRKISLEENIRNSCMVLYVDVEPTGEFRHGERERLDAERRTISALLLAKIANSQIQFCSNCFSICDLPTMKLPFTLLSSMGSLLAVSEGLSLKKDGGSRRDFMNVVTGTTALVAGIIQPFCVMDPASAAETGPFCVIGANGKTGTKCVQGLLERNIPVRATSRSGIYAEDPESKNPFLSPLICDVTNPSTIEAAIQGTNAVIFAASASKSGGTPTQVDNEGLVNVAKACIAAKVPHLVIVSSGSVTKPESPVYKFLNLFGKIMEEKIKGEDTVRGLYSSVEGSTYTIIRPGGLTEEPARGVTALELNQGDTKSGRISRFDVASLCIESTFYPKLSGGTTFECYDADTGKPLSSVGMSNIMKQKTDPADFVSGKERQGDSWENIFTGLEKD